nr:S8/S53 family peptidase [Roseibium sp. RKSG952]
MLGDPNEWPSCAQSCSGPNCPQVVLPDAIAHPQQDLDSVLTFLDKTGAEISYEAALGRYDACEPYSVAAANPADGSCKVREFNPTCDHTTSMASIISSKANELGLVGLSPNAPINVYDWEHASSGELARLITERANKLYQKFNGPQVFVFASKFPIPRCEIGVTHKDCKGGDPRGHDAHSYPGKWMQRHELSSPNVRVDQAPAQQVARAPVLWITAAGQGASPEKAWPLSSRAPVAPMNLGDQENVIVVTACDKCKWPDITISETANRGASDEDSPHSSRAVTIAAPGDGYTYHVDAATLSSIHGGTSQATAFVGGVTTAMLRCNPEAYVDETNVVRVERVKRRIILTSTPRLVPEDQAGQVPGVINPSALLKDPEKAWLVPVGQRGEGYQSLADPEICPTSRLHFFVFDEASGSRKSGSVSLTNTRRILRVPKALDGGPFDGDRFYIYTIDPDVSSGEAASWNVDIVGPVLIDDAVAAEPLFFTGDNALSLSDIEEVILPFLPLDVLPEGEQRCEL